MPMTVEYRNGVQSSTISYSNMVIPEGITNDVTQKGNEPLYDLWKNKNKGHSLYKKMGLITKITIRCKALDASQMAHVSALFSNAIFNISS